MQIQKFTDPVFTIRKDGKCLETIKIKKVFVFSFPVRRSTTATPSLSRPTVAVALNTNASTSSQNMTQKASDTDEYRIVAFEMRLWYSCCSYRGVKNITCHDQSSPYCGQESKYEMKQTHYTAFDITIKATNLAKHLTLSYITFYTQCVCYTFRPYLWPCPWRFIEKDKSILQTTFKPIHKIVLINSVYTKFI